MVSDEKRFGNNFFTGVTQASEGVFITLPRKKALYSCESVRSILSELDMGSLSIFQDEATISADNSSSCANGKQYKSHWRAKFADKIRQAKNFPEGDATRLWKRLAVAVETPQPRSNGVQFLDVYMKSDGDSHTPSPSSPANDCYISPLSIARDRG